MVYLTPSLLLLILPTLPFLYTSPISNRVSPFPGRTHIQRILYTIFYSDCLMKRKTVQGMDDSLKNSEDVVNYLIANVYKQNKIDFYQNLQLKALQFLVTVNFQNKNISYQDKIFVVTLIKQHPHILSIAIEREKFNFMLIFGFLRNQSTLEMDRLRALEEMFLPFCKKFPEKFIGMLAKHKEITAILLRSLYLKNVFRVVYTAVFCLHNPFISEFQDITSEIINAIANSVFDFALGTTQKLRFYDFTEVVINFNDFISDIVLNLGTVEVPLILALVSLIDKHHLLSFLSIFDRERQNSARKESNEALIQILSNIMRIFEAVKLNLTRQFSQEQKADLVTIQDKLKDNCIYLSTKLKYFMNILLQQTDLKLKYSSGEVISGVGMVRYRILQLIEKILSINELQDLKIKFGSFNFFIVIEYFLQNYKWNNIVHNLILNIAELVISQDYKHFKERYLTNRDNYHEDLFGNLIACFRNKKFMFLSSIRMTNNGNRCPIYQLSKMLVNEMKEQKDLASLIESFKLWKQFMEVDLKQFQRVNFTLAVKPDNDGGLSPPQRKSRHRSFDFSRSPAEMKEPSTRSLQTFEQILLKLKEEDKWSPKKQPEKLLSKKKIQNSLSRFDSMGILSSQLQQ